ncbi:hypothetical protein [Streptomyces sp. NBC_00859]|uniref:hypothetical protein n=1 Tax=Streptomyces sp. NBC_00859 TaxID=2903682 RepID=UPI0038678447|nr:hypothetical protein OG584_12550 [Streptomyces sp. NBC_00859]
MSGEVLRSFPAGAPRGAWTAEAYAAERRGEGIPAEVVMDLESDSFLVVLPERSPAAAGA